ncbi:lactate utilization protein [uncultured Oscillibacter sp.]|uniref:lactate utilization protein n=1 Tax=uncultured Oscillibacter sp. TaxID=876091 RepID=UPI0025FB861B|nr:lactate utilization protein [uncultured Oscillibacter sp.]
MADFTKVEQALRQRGYTVRVFETGAEAADYLNGAIDGVSVGIGGSVTVQQLGLYDRLAAHNQVYWHWQGGPEQRTRAAGADVYLTSANGLAETGEILNIDGAGNRVASTLYGHKKVYFVIGANKLAPTRDEALWRARNIAAPRNAQRLEKKTPCAVNGDRCYDCKSPDRICRGLVELWGPMMGMEAEVILVNEDLGM